MAGNTINVNSELGVAAALEAKRLAEKYNKDFLILISIKMVAILRWKRPRSRAFPA